MTAIKGECVLVAQEKNHATEKFEKGKLYKFTKQIIPSLNQYGYIIINDDDPGKPLKMKEETFNLYFKEADPNSSKKEENHEEDKEENQEPDSSKENKTSPSISGPKKKSEEKIDGKTKIVKEKEVLNEDVNPLMSIASIVDHLDSIKSIQFIPRDDKNLTVVVNIHPDITFTDTGVPEKILRNFPEMIEGLFSLEAKIANLNDVIEERLEAEKSKLNETKASNTSSSKDKKTSTAKDASAKSKSKETSEKAKESDLFNQKQQEKKAAEKKEESKEEESNNTEAEEADDEWA